MRSISVRITGLVQGVGFRPFVAEQAQALHLSGWVKNSGGIVIVELTGSEQAVGEWFHRLYHFSPEGARIDRVEVRELENVEGRKDSGFSIIHSSRENESMRWLPADRTICPVCEQELFDHSNRRYRHPFISCTSCGPRYSILKEVPYDREHITMEPYGMCEECAIEYAQRGNRRRHAQTIACHHCGPVLRAKERQSEVVYEREDALTRALEVLRSHQVIALKDIGGYHFCCLASDEKAAMKLRAFKKRDQKPFAVMFPDLASVNEYCEVSPVESELLQSNARPIVLLNKKKDFPVVICGASSKIGAMLACNPLQLLLLKETGPLVMTSGNRGGEPIVIEDEKMMQYMNEGFPELILYHDREILEPLEDSIYQVSPKLSIVQIIRRARGLVPEPIFLKRKLKHSCLGAGGDLKAVFGLGKETVVYLSSSFGDLIHPDAAKKRQLALRRMMDLLVVDPEKMICDRHPGYQSVRLPESLDKAVTCQKVQHHHAHIASVMAEYGLEGDVLGVAYDGTGYGDDGAIWGSEFLLCQGKDYQRAGSLKPVLMPGSDRTAVDGWIPAWSYLDEAVCDGIVSREELILRMSGSQKKRFQILCAARKSRMGQMIAVSSMGRLFDAVATILEICDRNEYEGQCPTMLEARAQRYKTKKFFDHKKTEEITGRLIRFCGENHTCIDGAWIVAQLFFAKADGMDAEWLAYCFHMAISRMTMELCKRICGNSVRQIALSGGTWYNQILLEQVVEGLTKEGYSVYVNKDVPSGDGGLALGQLWLATFES